MAVYTEAASGAYLFAPILAAMAGARRVYALTADSSYGPGAEIDAMTLSAARRVGVSERLHITLKKAVEHVADSDIITNSGFVRPIDRTMISWMKPTAVVPLMWE